jgi:hypothetical protein
MARIDWKLKAGADAIHRLYKGTIQLRGSGSESMGAKIFGELTVFHTILIVGVVILLLFGVLTIYRNRFKITRRILTMKGYELDK